MESNGPLREDCSTDICIVGAGIAGLSVTNHLVREGRDVLVLEDRAPGAGVTGQTTGHLASALDGGFSRLRSLHGEEGRASLRSILPVLQQSGRTAMHYAEWVMYPWNGPDPEDLPRVRGMVRREGIHPVALYRDGEGRLHARSAVCPHMGCLVHWSEPLESWECPCHGSRFAPEGTLLQGPAVEGLGPPGGG